MLVIPQARYVGLKIRQLRKKRNLTQAELSAKIGVQQSDLSRMEKGEYRISLDILFKILEVFQMSMVEFFEEIAPKENNELQNEFLKEFSSLSKEEQEEILDFIRFKKLKGKGQEKNES